MIESRNISVRTEPDIVANIDAAAKAQDRSRNWWINQAIKSALAEENAWIEQVELGLKAANVGDFALDDEVEAVFGRYI